jgi:hypothetical protein
MDLIQNKFYVTTGGQPPSESSCFVPSVLNDGWSTEKQQRKM